MSKKTPDEVKAQLALTTWLLKQRDIETAVKKAHSMLINWQFDNVTVDERYDDSDFCLFWEAYPKKVGKGDAFKSWKKLKPGKKLVTLILQSVELHKQGERWMEDGGKFIPNPATWLNQSRYDDEVVVKGKTQHPQKQEQKVEYVYDDKKNTMVARPVTK